MKRFVFAFVLFALAFAARSGGPRSIGPYDEAYHWKRIAWSAGAPVDSRPDAATSGLTSLDFDRDRGVRGAFCPWPPLYDAAMGAVARAIGMERVVWIPPIAFSIFVALLAFLWSGVDPDNRTITAAMTAAIAIAASPYLIGISRVAAIDHHWTEPIFVVAIAAAVIRRSPIGLALGLTAALFVQSALIVACGVALLAIVLVDATGPALRAGFIGFAVAAAIVSFYRLTRPPGYPASPWFLGTTHAALLAAAALTCAIALALPSNDTRGPHDRAGMRSSASATLSQTAGALLPQDEISGERHAPFAARLLALAFGAIALLPLASSLAAGARFFRGDPWLQSIVEFQPMFRDPSRIGTDLANLGGGVLALSIALAAEWRFDGKRRVLESRAVRTIALFAFSYFVLALSSRRFLVPGIALFAIAGAMAVYSHRRWVTVVALLLTLAPPLAYDIHAATHPDLHTVDAVVPLAASIAPLPPGRVLAPWHAGHAIDVFGHHAVVIDNFGSMPDARLFAEANAVLIATDPGALARWCRGHDVRYLALLNPELHIPAAAACSGRNPDDYRQTPLARSTGWSRLWRGEKIAGFARVAPDVWRVETAY